MNKIGEKEIRTVFDGKLHEVGSEFIEAAFTILQTTFKERFGESCRENWRDITEDDLPGFYADYDRAIHESASDIFFTIAVYLRERSRLSIEDTFYSIAKEIAQLHERRSIQTRIKARAIMGKLFENILGGEGLDDGEDNGEDGGEDGGEVSQLNAELVKDILKGGGE